MRILGAVALLVALVVATWRSVHVGVPNENPVELLTLIGLLWALFAAGAVVVQRLPARVAVVLIVVGAVALQLAALSGPPRLTDDFHRYAWDGRVQAAGIDPYRYPPVDPALAPLRDDWLFPPECRVLGDARSVPCTRLNHPSVPTIYPPLAQAGFWVLHVVTAPFGPDGGGALSLQVAAALVALATTGVLLAVLRRTGDPRRAVLWAWCPVVVLEAGNNAHVDVLAALAVAVACGAAAAGHVRRTGLALGAAISAKLLPAVLFPAFLAGRGRTAARRALAVLGVAGATVLAGYLPHVVVLGSGVLGFLPGYLHEEGYDGSSRFGLLRPWVPDAATPYVAGAILALAAVLVWWFGDARRPWAAGVVLAGVTMLVPTVTYPWYALTLVVLVALGGRAEWLAVGAGAYPVYFTAALHEQFGTTHRAGYGTALAVVLAVTVWRARRASRARRDRSDRSVGRGGGGPHGAHPERVLAARWTATARPEGAWRGRRRCPPRRPHR